MNLKWIVEQKWTFWGYGLLIICILALITIIKVNKRLRVSLELAYKNPRIEYKQGRTIYKVKYLKQDIKVVEKIRIVEIPGKERTIYIDRTTGITTGLTEGTTTQEMVENKKEPIYPLTPETPKIEKERKWLVLIGYRIIDQPITVGIGYKIRRFYIGTGLDISPTRALIWGGFTF